MTREEGYTKTIARYSIPPIGNFGVVRFVGEGITPYHIYQGGRTVASVRPTDSRERDLENIRKAVVKAANRALAERREELEAQMEKLEEAEQAASDEPEDWVEGYRVERYGQQD